MKKLFSLTILLLLAAACTRVETRNNRPLAKVPSEVLSTETIQAIIKKDIARFHACIKKAAAVQKKAPPKNGEIGVRILIAGNGAVKEASKDFANFRNLAFETCAIDYAYSLRFSPTLNGNDVDITYPLSLTK